MKMSLDQAQVLKMKILLNQVHVLKYFGESYPCSQLYVKQPLMCTPWLLTWAGDERVCIPVSYEFSVITIYQLKIFLKTSPRQSMDAADQ